MNATEQRLITNRQDNTAKCLRPPPKVDHSGEKFGRLTLLSLGEPYIISSTGKTKQRYYCSCDCGRYTPEHPKLIVYEAMKSGLVTSCGCYRKEVSANTCREKAVGNKYEFFNDCVIGYASNNNKPFYIDIEDYEKIKDYTWYMTKLGYLISKKDNIGYKLHNVVMNITPTMNKYIDHINHNTSDNRKINLRIVSASKNQMNKVMQKNNTSGVTGVMWHSRDQIWEARIGVNKNDIYLGRFRDFNEAVNARKKAEEKYFGKYSYDNSVNSVEEVQK